MGRKYGYNPFGGGYSAKVSYHVVPTTDGGWDVTTSGSSPATKHFTTKQDALDFARRAAHVQGSRLVIHRSDGGVKDIESLQGESFRNGSRLFYDARENSGNGVFGDQTDATAEKGAELFEAATEQLVELLEWLDAQAFEDLMPAAHVDPQPGSRR